MTYSEKLKDPKWQKKRLEVLNRDEWKCKFCSDKETTLHVHHISYKNVDPWEYDNDNFLTLCEHCHQLAEFLKENKFPYRLIALTKLEVEGNNSIVFYCSTKDYHVILFRLFKDTRRVECIVRISLALFEEINGYLNKFLKPM